MRDSLISLKVNLSMLELWKRTVRDTFHVKKLVSKHERELKNSSSAPILRRQILECMPFAHFVK